MPINKTSQNKIINYRINSSYSSVSVIHLNHRLYMDRYITKLLLITTKIQLPKRLNKAELLNAVERKFIEKDSLLNLQ